MIVSNLRLSNGVACVRSYGYLGGKGDEC